MAAKADVEVLCINKCLKWHDVNNTRYGLNKYTNQVIIIYINLSKEIYGYSK